MKLEGLHPEEGYGAPRPLSERQKGGRFRIVVRRTFTHSPRTQNLWRILVRSTGREEKEEQS